MKKEITFVPAFDKRNSNPSKSYGIHGVDIKFIYGDGRGYVQFVLYTNWQLPSVEEEALAKANSSIATNRYPFVMWQKPMAADLGYHSPTPIFEGQDPMDNCHLLGGGKCYYDGSRLNAERIFTVLREQGSEGVWSELESYWKELFS